MAVTTKAVTGRSFISAAVAEAARGKTVAGAGGAAMTEPSPVLSSPVVQQGAKSPPRKGRPGPGVVISGAIALFAVTFGFLTYQLRSGNDPALGAQALAGQPRPVLIRRVIQHRIVTRVVPAPGASSTTVSTSAAPVTTNTAAAAPAPAPVTTGAS